MDCQVQNLRSERPGPAALTGPAPAHGPRMSRSPSTIASSRDGALRDSVRNPAPAPLGPDARVGITGGKEKIALGLLLMDYSVVGLL